MGEPGWKRNGRNGPFDWWLACNQHGYQWVDHCMSCGIASEHNADFAIKLKHEGERPAEVRLDGEPEYRSWFPAQFPAAELDAPDIEEAIRKWFPR